MKPTTQIFWRNLKKKAIYANSAEQTLFKDVLAARTNGIVPEAVKLPTGPDTKNIVLDLQKINIPDVLVVFVSSFFQF